MVHLGLQVRPVIQRGVLPHHLRGIAKQSLAATAMLPGPFGDPAADPVPNPAADPAVEPGRDSKRLKTQGSASGDEDGGDEAGRRGAPASDVLQEKYIVGHREVRRRRSRVCAPFLSRLM